MSKEYIDNLLKEFPKIPEFYRKDDLAKFRGADTNFRASAKSFPIQISKLFIDRKKEAKGVFLSLNWFEEYYNSGRLNLLDCCPLDHEYEAWTRKTIDKYHDKYSDTQTAIYCGPSKAKSVDGAGRRWNVLFWNIAWVDNDDLPYLKTKVKEHQISKVLSVLEPNRTQHTPWAEKFAKTLHKFCEKDSFYAPELAKVVAGETPEKTLSNYGKFLYKWGVAKSKLLMFAGEFAKGGYDLPKEKEIER